MRLVVRSGVNQAIKNSSGNRANQIRSGIFSSNLLAKAEGQHLKMLYNCIHLADDHECERLRVSPFHKSVFLENRAKIKQWLFNCLDFSVTHARNERQLKSIIKMFKDFGDDEGVATSQLDSMMTSGVTLQLLSTLFCESYKGQSKKQKQAFRELFDGYSDYLDLFKDFEGFLSFERITRGFKILCLLRNKFFYNYCDVFLENRAKIKQMYSRHYDGDVLVYGLDKGDFKDEIKACIANLQEVLLEDGRCDQMRSQLDGMQRLASTMAVPEKQMHPYTSGGVNLWQEALRDRVDLYTACHSYAKEFYDLKAYENDKGAEATEPKDLINQFIADQEDLDGSINRGSPMEDFECLAEYLRNAVEKKRSVLIEKLKIEEYVKRHEMVVVGRQYCKKILESAFIAVDRVEKIDLSRRLFEASDMCGQEVLLKLLEFRIDLMAWEAYRSKHLKVLVLFVGDLNQSNLEYGQVGPHEEALAGLEKRYDKVKKHDRDRRSFFQSSHSRSSARIDCTHEGDS